MFDYARHKALCQYVATVVVLLIATWHGHAQYDPLYSQYQFNTLTINPAYAGSRDVLSTMFLSRNQWVGFEGAPITRSFTAHTPLHHDYTSLGLSATHDQTGPLTQTLLFADYAFRFRISPKARIALGLKAGINQLAVDFNSLDRTPGQHDPAYDEGNLNKTMPNFGFGIYISHPAYYLGISAPRLIENDFTSTESGNAVVAGSETRNYFVTTGVIFPIGENIKLKPSLMVRLAEASPINTDINLNLLFIDKLWLGGMYRPGSAWGAVTQYQISNQIKVGYAIEFTTNALQSFNNGTHEVMLMYEFRFKKQKVFSPRYF
jgi:type IX secretion system PorP/SprF family membrane protein